MLDAKMEHIEAVFRDLQEGYRHHHWSIFHLRWSRPANPTSSLCTSRLLYSTHTYLHSHHPPCQLSQRAHVPVQESPSQARCRCRVVQWLDHQFWVWGLLFVNSCFRVQHETFKCSTVVYNTITSINSYCRIVVRGRFAKFLATVRRLIRTGKHTFPDVAHCHCSSRAARSKLLV